MIAAIIQLDFAALQAAQLLISPALTQAMLFLTFFGHPIFWFVVAAFIYWLGKENESFFLMNLVLFSAAVAGALKFAVARPRPSAETFRVLALDNYSTFSFPSGHSTLIAAAFSYSWRFIKKHERALFAILVLLVAFSRLYLGMHFLSDVLAGIALGLLIGKMNLFARNRLFHRDFRPSKLEDEIAIVALVAFGVLAVIFLQPLPLSAALLGFYAGFFLFKEMNIKQKKIGRNQLLVKQALGLAFLAAIFVGTRDILLGEIFVTNLEQFALYLVGGFWVSWGWPSLWETFLNARKQ